MSVQQESWFQGLLARFFPVIELEARMARANYRKTEEESRVWDDCVNKILERSTGSSITCWVLAGAATSALDVPKRSRPIWWAMTGLVGLAFGVHSASSQSCGRILTLLPNSSMAGEMVAILEQWHPNHRALPRARWMLQKYSELLAATEDGGLTGRGGEQTGGSDGGPAWSNANVFVRLPRLASPAGQGVGNGLDGAGESWADHSASGHPSEETSPDLTSLRRLFKDWEGTPPVSRDRILKEWANRQLEENRGRHTANQSGDHPSQHRPGPRAGPDYQPGSTGMHAGADFEHGTAVRDSLRYRRPEGSVLRSAEQGVGQQNGFKGGSRLGGREPGVVLAANLREEPGQDVFSALCGESMADAEAIGKETRSVEEQRRFKREEALREGQRRRQLTQEERREEYRRRKGELQERPREEHSSRQRM